MIIASRGPSCAGLIIVWVMTFLLGGGMTPELLADEIGAEMEDEQTIERVLLELLRRGDAKIEVDLEMETVIRLAGERNYEAALEQARAILRKNPDHAAARFMEGAALMALDRHKEALIVWQDLYERDPDHPAVLNNLAWLYATADDPALRNPEKAVELARRAALADPGHPAIWSTLAQAYYVNRDFDRALTAARKALSLAQEMNASVDTLARYHEQVITCREAATAFSIFD